MIHCPTCQVENSEASKFCSACGNALTAFMQSADVEATATFAKSDGNNAPSQSSLDSSSIHGRFIPGTIIDERYRIVSLAGKGGMGEVYRADDLKLGHPVALKFLPPELTDDAERLEYFHNEVRYARQISHPHVCRVYDIGDVKGQQFLSMEYIDGEDLRSLLNRIGHVSQDKGVEIAQQLCAGLAAAHDRGVLHRDLKPANIMIDGRGHVRISDFGLAKPSDEIEPGELAGTPAYMAPEQLSQGITSKQSDLYSLGLIFYELFTGKKIKSGTELNALLDESTSTGSSISQTSSPLLDPAILVVIRKCLQKDPNDRFATALEVAAALPGGDPLAAAMARGETPSPEMVAAAGSTGTLPMKYGVALFAGICLILIVYPFFAQWRNLFHLQHMEGKPDTFEAKAKMVLNELGYAEFKDSQVSGFEIAPDRQNLRYWYRQSPKPIVPNIPDLTLRPIYWKTSYNNPPVIIKGMTNLKLDPAMNLVQFIHVPTSEEETSDKNLKEQIRSICQLSSLNLDIEFDQEQDSKLTDQLKDAEFFRIIEPEDYPANSIPSVFASDSMVYRSRDFDNRYVVLSLWKGKIVYFRVFNTNVKSSIERTLYYRWKNTITGFNQILIIFVALIFAIRNINHGKADLKTAFLFAQYFFWIDIFLWFLSVHHSGDLNSDLQFARSYLVRSIGYSVRLWLYYVAIEPLVRRYWPEVLISWTRLTSGKIRDPRIGRDILIGLSVGIVWTYLGGTITKWEYLIDPAAVTGIWHYLERLFSAHQSICISSFYYLAYLLLFRMIFRNNWMTVLVTGLFMAFSYWPENWNDPRILTYITFYLMLSLLFIRFGLVCASFMLLQDNLIRTLGYTSGFSWYSEAGNLALLTLFVIAAYGFYTSTLSANNRTES